MPPVAPIVAGAAAFWGAASTLAAGWGSLLAAVSIGVGAGLAVDSMMDAANPNVSTPNVENRGHLVNLSSTQNVVPLVYGQRRVGITRVYVGVSGSSNQYLHIVGTLGEGTMDSIVEKGGVPQVWLGDKLYTEYGSNVTYEFKDGAADQTAISGLPDGWNDALRYTAYVYLKLEFDHDLFQNVPPLTVEMKGLEVYDPDTETTAYSNNPALCLRDFMTRSSARGGMGIASTRIDDDTVNSAASYCAAKGWTCNMIVNQQQSVVDNLRLLLNNFRGAVVFSQNKFKVLYRDLNYESSVMSLDETDVAEVSGDSSLNITQPDVLDTPNAVRIKFLDEDAKDQINDYVLTDSASVTADGDYREHEVKCYGLDYEHAMMMAAYYLERLRVNKTVSFIGGPKLMALEPHDVIQLTHEVPGWAEKLFRVVSVAQQPDHNVAVSLVEESEDFYDDTLNLSSHQWHDTTLPDPMAEVPSVTGVSHAEEVYYYRGRSFTRWKIDFSGPAAATYPWWDYAEIWVKIGSGDWRFMTKSGGGYAIDPVEEGETYYCRLVSVSIHGVRENFNYAYTVSKTILGKTAAPSNLAAMTAVANGDSVNIFALAITDPDVDGYEVRLGDSWDGGIFISFNRAPSIRLTGVRPGTHTFWMSPKDNAGNYSATPVSATVTVFLPSGYSELATYGSWSWDFSTGTHDNTEQETDSPCSSGDPCVKCSHTSGVLTGTWTSPTYDLNAVEIVRVWGDFRTVFESSDTTWDGVAPSSTTWNALGATKTWNQIFQPAQAGQVRAKLLHKQLVGDSWSEIDYFEILCAEVEARYLAVEIEITDPTADSELHVKTLNMFAYEGAQEV